MSRPKSPLAQKIDSALREELNRLNLRFQLSGGSAIAFTVFTRDTPKAGGRVLAEVTYGFIELAFWPADEREAVKMLVDGVRVATEKAERQRAKGARLKNVVLRQPPPEVKRVEVSEDLEPGEPPV